MTDYRSMYDKDYIGAWDLQERDVDVTITRVVAGQLVGQGGRKTKKPVAYMRGTEKGFAINSTNGKAIAGMYGPLVENWIGKRITLYKSTTRNPNGDGEVECIRVRPAPPRAKQPDAEPQQFDMPPAHQPPPSSLVGEADNSGAPPSQPGAAAALPSEVEAFGVLLREWLEAIREGASAEAVQRTADRAPDKVKTADEFAAAVRAKLDSFKEKK